MSWLWLILALVVLQRLGELAYAKRNTSQLLRQGAKEVGSGHYPLLVLLHGAWLIAMAFWIPAERAPNWILIAIFVSLQAGRIWVIRSLGRFWTTRIITLPNAPLIRRGPYRFIRHPNYLIVALEIALLPLAFGAWEIALVFSLLNAALLIWRIRLEESAIAARKLIE